MRGKVSSYTGAAAFAALSTVFHTRNAAHLPAVQGPEADRFDRREADVPARARRVGVLPCRRVRRGRTYHPLEPTPGSMTKADRPCSGARMRPVE
jgi:hypothetical protein